MIRFRDFVPEMLAAPGLFKAGEYESMDAALAAANSWINEYALDSTASRCIPDRFVRSTP